MVSVSLVNCAIDGKKKDNYDISKVYLTKSMVDEIFNSLWFLIYQTDSFEVRPNLEDPKEICFIHDSKIEKEINKSAVLFDKSVSWTMV